LLAVKKMDKVIEVIRRAKDPAEARAALCTEKFGLSPIQVRDLLDVNEDGTVTLIVIGLIKLDFRTFHTSGNSLERAKRRRSVT